MINVSNAINFSDYIKKPEYNFLRDNEHLGDNVILLTLGGSYAYGMNKEGSDVDIRGIAFNSAKELLTYKDFEQVVDVPTDTTIYSVNKIITLLTSCNPNTIEMLGSKPEHYIKLTDAGKFLLDNKKLFLSKLAIHTFSGYANAQLRRLENKAARTISQAKNEEHILKTINNAYYELKQRYELQDINLYVGDSSRDDMEKEIFIDANFSHYPLRDWTGLWNELKVIVSSFEKFGKRNKNAVTHEKLSKHMAHLIRLYIMGIDILEKEDIITYREDEHDLLMDIRNGKYLDSNQQPTTEFYEMLNEFEKRFDYAKENTSLPDKPNYKQIEELRIMLNKYALERSYHLGNF